MSPERLDDDRLREIAARDWFPADPDEAAISNDEVKDMATELQLWRAMFGPLPQPAAAAMPRDETTD